MGERCEFYYCEGEAGHGGSCFDYLCEHYPESPQSDGTCTCERCLPVADSVAVRYSGGMATEPKTRAEQVRNALSTAGRDDLAEMIGTNGAGRAMRPGCRIESREDAELIAAAMLASMGHLDHGEVLVQQLMNLDVTRLADGDVLGWPWHWSPMADDWVDTYDRADWLGFEHLADALIEDRDDGE